MKIETKFDKGDKGYIIHKGKIYVATIEPVVDINYFACFNPRPYIDEDGFEDLDVDMGLYEENEIFTTREEAEEKLREIEDET